MPRPTQPSRSSRHRRLAGSALWLLSGGAALAQATPGSGVTLEELSIAGLGDGGATIGYQPKRSTFGAGSDTAILDTPANIAVVSAKVLRDQRVISLDEALRNVSGIAQTNNVGGTQEAVVRRGFGTFRDDSILRDGRRTVLQQNFSYAIERVEVLKGPASLLYGITDPGGLINLVSKRPEFTSHGSLNLTSTSFGGGLVQGDLTGPIEGTNLAYRMVADIQSYDYWRNFGHLSRQVVAPSLTWKGDDTTVTVGYEFSHYRVPYDRGTIFDPRTGRPLAVPRSRRFDERSSQHEATSHLATLDVDHRFDADWKLHFGYSYSHLGYDENQIRPVTYFPATGLLTRRADGTRDADFNAHVARLDLTGRFDTFGLRHDLLAGVTYENIDYGRSYIIRGANRTGFNPFRPVYGTLSTVPVISAADSNLRERLSTTSLYLQDSLHLTDQWILVAGFSTQIFDQFGAKGTPAVAYTDIDGVRVLPRVGLVYKLAPNLSLYGSYSQSFKPNTSLATIVGALAPEGGRGLRGRREGRHRRRAHCDGCDVRHRQVERAGDAGRQRKHRGEHRRQGALARVRARRRRPDPARLGGDRELRLHPGGGHEGSSAGGQAAAQHPARHRLGLPDPPVRRRGGGRRVRIDALRCGLPRGWLRRALCRRPAGGCRQQLQAARIRRLRRVPGLQHPGERPADHAPAQPEEPVRPHLLFLLRRQQPAGGGR